MSIVAVGLVLSCVAVNPTRNAKSARHYRDSDVWNNQYELGGIRLGQPVPKARLSHHPATRVYTSTHLPKLS